MAALLCGGDPRLAGGAVGIARIDKHGVDASAAGGEIPPVNDQWRGLDFVAGVERSSGGGLRGNDGGEIGAATRFDAGAHGSPEKSTGQGGGCVHEAFTLTIVKRKSGQS